MNSASSVSVRDLMANYHRWQHHVHNLHELMAQPSFQNGWCAKVQVEAQRLQEVLTHYFRLQDQDGYLEQVEEQAPHYHERVQLLLQEQRVLLIELANFQADWKRGSTTGIQRLERVLDQLKDHETQENLLLLNAFNEEAGAMD